MSYRLLPQAESDLDEIAIYIAHDNKTAAERWTGDMFRRFSLISTMPEIGVDRGDLRAGLRIMPSGSYLVLYRSGDSGVEIVRTLHGRRDWHELL